MSDTTRCPDGACAAIQARTNGAFEGQVDSSSADELAAARRRLLGIAANWGLSDLEVGRLLGHRGCWRCGALSSDAEARMRMLFDIEPLVAMAVSVDDAMEWLREPNPAFIGYLTPLEAMSLGRHAVRQVRDALRDRLEGS